MNLFVGILLVLVLLVAAAVAWYVTRRSQRGRNEDFGEVSSQWLIEHRAGSGYDISRWSNR